MAKQIKIVSWNVNGIRAALKKGFIDYVKQEDPDILCIQETKAQQGQAEVDLPEYTEYWNSAVRKGYSGTAIFTKQQPLSVRNGIFKNGELVKISDSYGEVTSEGRVIAAEFEQFFVVTVYTPNSKRELTRLKLRDKEWDPAFLEYMQELEKSKPVVFCGDLNVAHKEIDLEHPATNRGEHGFTDEERAGFDNILAAGFVDTLRLFQPDTPKLYTWWAPFGGARAKNVGWRIDYFCVSAKLKDTVKDSFIRPEIMGSDHCPIGVVLEF